MNKNAFEILTDNKLEGPKYYSWKELFSMSQTNTQVYLRYDSKFSTRNRVVSVREVLGLKETFIAELERGELLYIEKVYECIYGGATLVKASFMYTEIVSGHPVSLLRHGLCGGRFISTSENHYYHSSAYQRFQAKRNRSSFVWIPSKKSKIEELLLVVKQVVSGLSQRKDTDLLLEWFFTEGKIIFCDARKRGFDNFGNSLPDLRYQKEVVAFLGSENPKWVAINNDKFIVDTITPEKNGNLFVCSNSSLLCHFITRNLKTNNQVNFFLPEPFTNVRIIK